MQHYCLYLSLELPLIIERVHAYSNNSDNRNHNWPWIYKYWTFKMVSSSKYTTGMENFFQSVAILKATIPLAGQRSHRNHENVNSSPSLVEPGPVLPYIVSCGVVRKQPDGDNGGSPWELGIIYNIVSIGMKHYAYTFFTWDWMSMPNKHHNLNLSIWYIWDY